MAGTGTASQINPSYISALFPNGLPQVQAQTGQGYTQQILNSLLPVFQQQQAGLRESQADAGIVGGSTPGAMGALADQQLTQALGQLVPSAQSTDAQNLGAQEYNTSNSLNTAQYDTGTANTIAEQILAMQNNNYETSQQDQYGLATGAAGGTSAAFQPVYQQPAASNGFSNLAGAFGAQSAGTTAAASPYGSTGAAVTADTSAYPATTAANYGSVEDPDYNLQNAPTNTSLTYGT